MNINETYRYSSTELRSQKRTKSDIYDLKYGGNESSNIRQDEREKTGAFLVLNMILNSLNLKKDAAVLNVGVNDGREMLSLDFTNVVGTDLSRNALKRGLEMFSDSKFLLTDVETLPFTADRFDLIISLRTLQCSLLDKEQAIKEIQRVVRDKHAVVISSPTGYLSKNDAIVKGLMSKGQIDPERADREIELLKKLLTKQKFDIVGVFQAPIETFIMAIANKSDKGEAK
jgi:SAM-dependent methyltransferase